MQQQRGGHVVRHDARDVGGGREAADQLAAAALARLQLLLQVLQVQEALGRLGDAHDVGAHLPPRQQVRVVLAGPHEHDGRLGQTQRLDQLVHGARAPAAGKDDHVVLRGVDRVPDDVASLMPEEGGLQRGDAGGGVRVAVAGEHLGHDVVLDELQRPPRRRVVAVHHFSPPKGAAESGAFSNDVVIYVFYQFHSIFTLLAVGLA